MAQWEYRKIDLNHVPVKASDLDALNDAGKDGWEFVAITANNIAYLKRQLQEAAPAQQARVLARASRRKASSSS